jgi:hypothetical protein
MDRLEEMQKALYEREYKEKEKTTKREFFHAENAPVRGAWGGEEFPPEPTPPPEPRKTLSIMKKIFIGSAIFFALAVALASFVFLRGGNVVSSEKVALEFAAPLSAAGGEPFAFQVSVRNDNSAKISSADLILEFPDGTRSADGSNSHLLRYREALGSISRGESLTKKHEVVLFGEEGESLMIKATLEYKVEGSNALLKKSTSYEIALQSAPISISVEGPRETANNGEFDLSINVSSNSAAPLRDVLISAEYPFGFALKSSSPRPISGEKIWSVGDLAPSASRKIKISGTISGSEGDERVFSFKVGTAKESGGRTMQTALVSVSHSILLRRPFLALSLLIDGNSGNEYITEKGKTLRVGVSWENNLPSRATDAQIIVSLNGALYDPASVVPEVGYYRADQGTIVWDSSSDGMLSSIEPGARGQKSFSVNVRGPSTGVYALKNPSFNISATISARGPAGAGESGGAVQTKTTTAVKLLADLSLSSRLLRYGGNFSNSGPVPPKVGNQTSYTVIWSLSNAFNDLANARVSATLPSYMTFLKNISPSNENVSYDAVSGSLVWEVGDVKSGVGIGGAPREVEFQVAIVPPDNLSGTTPIVVGEASAQGDDKFTGRQVISATRPPLTTRFGDASFVAGQEVVGR